MGESLFSHSWDKDAMLEGEGRELAADEGHVMSSPIKPRDSRIKQPLSFFLVPVNISMILQ